MRIFVYARGVRRAGTWSEVDAPADLDAAANVARSWYAKGYETRIEIRRPAP